MEVLGLVFICVTLLMVLIIAIGSIVFLVKDGGKNNQNITLWVVLYIFFGQLVLSVYLFATKRIGWGLFWLMGYPTLLVVAFFFGFLLVG